MTHFVTIDHLGTGKTTKLHMMAENRTCKGGGGNKLFGNFKTHWTLTRVKPTLKGK